jgi:hypothetical protein
MSSRHHNLRRYCGPVGSACPVPLREQGEHRNVNELPAAHFVDLLGAAVGATRSGVGAPADAGHAPPHRRLPDPPRCRPDLDRQ